MHRATVATNNERPKWHLVAIRRQWVRIGIGCNANHIFRINKHGWESKRSLGSPWESWIRKVGLAFGPWPIRLWIGSTKRPRLTVAWFSWAVIWGDKKWALSTSMVFQFVAGGFGSNGLATLIFFPTGFTVGAFAFSSSFPGCGLMDNRWPQCRGVLIAVRSLARGWQVVMGSLPSIWGKNYRVPVDLLWFMSWVG